MGTALIVLATIGGVIGSIFVGLLKDEANAWLPSLSRWLLAAAVRRVPVEKRERCAEEWEAHVLEYPGRLSQLFQIFRFLLLSFEMQEIDRQTVYKSATYIFSIQILYEWSVSLYQRFSGLNPVLDHLLGFAHFATGALTIIGLFWLIWRRKQVLHAIRGPSR